MGTVQVQVTFDTFGEFLEIPGLPTILRVEKDNLRRVATVSLYVEGLADCQAYLIRHSEEGEVTGVWLIPEFPLADTGVRFRWGGRGVPPENLRQMLRPPWGPEPPARTGSEWNS